MIARLPRQFRVSWQVTSATSKSTARICDIQRTYREVGQSGKYGCRVLERRPQNESHYETEEEDLRKTIDDSNVGV